jgi:hypothetical protein
MDRTDPPDFVAFLQAADKWIGDELDLRGLQAGDRLLVRTRNTGYLFAMTGSHTAELTPDRADRPRGSVRIEGCVFGRSQAIKPDHVFCGGGLEILFDGHSQPMLTTAIEAIQVVRRSPPGGA